MSKDYSGPNRREICEMECWPNRLIEKMSEQLGEVHDYVTSQKAKEEQRKESWSKTKDRFYIAMASVAIVGGMLGIWAYF